MPNCRIHDLLQGEFAFTAPASMQNHHAFQNSVQHYESSHNNNTEWNEESEEDFAAAYAYTSLPFMVSLLTLFRLLFYYCHKIIRGDVIVQQHSHGVFSVFTLLPQSFLF